MNSEETLLANMFIGYFIPASKWPCPFASLGLRLMAIQRPFTVEFKGRVRNVRPEAVLAADDCDWLIALEIKSRMVGADQIGCYAMLESAAMRRDLVLKPIAHAIHDVVVMTERVNVERLERNIRRVVTSLGITINGDSTFPIIGRDENSVRIECGSITRCDVDEKFREGITAACTDSAPTHFLRFTSDSPTSALVPDVVNIVHRKIVREEGFTTRNICEMVVPYWSVLGSEERRAIVNKVQRILSKAAKEDYSDFITLGNISSYDAAAAEWGVVIKKLNAQRLGALNSARTGFLAKYKDSNNNQFRTDQMPLV